MNISKMIVKYAELIENLEGTPFGDTPWLSMQVFHNGKWNDFEYHPDFHVLENHEVRFAVSVLEGRLVFPGDKVFNKLSGTFIYAVETPEWNVFGDDIFTWPQEEESTNTKDMLKQLFTVMEYHKTCRPNADPLHLTGPARRVYTDDPFFRQAVVAKLHLYLDIFEQILKEANERRDNNS